jgi:hypothetical protein
MVVKVNMLEICKPFNVPRSKLGMDLLCMAFWLFLVVGLFAAISLDRNLTKRALWFELLPLLFLIFSTRTFMSHIRAGQTRMHEQGLEMAGERGPQILEWKNMEKPLETRGGLTVRGKRGEHVFIPRAVMGYDGIRKQIMQMAGGQKVCPKTEGSGNPQPSGS